MVFVERKLTVNKWTRWLYVKNIIYIIAVNGSTGMKRLIAVYNAEKTVRVMSWLVGGW